MNPKIRVTPKGNGAVISVNGLDITITVTPSVEEPVSSAPPQIEPTMSASRIEQVRLMLEEYLDELNIREEVASIVVEPKSFLRRDRFASIAAIVEELGGSYISAGRESRFLIPKYE